MKPIVNVTPRAQADIVELRDYIAQDSPRAARRFYLAVEKATKLLAAMPEMGGECEFASSKTRDMRVWSIRKFRKFLIFYHPIENGIDEVVRVLHGARDLDALFE
jgi:toxin ParE1/3/4